MKTRISKKILSLFLVVLMLVTSVPAFSIAAQADDNTRDKYLFAYFSGDDVNGQPVTYQKIRFAVSSDGKKFEPLNANLPLLDAHEEDTSKVVCYNNTWGKFGHTDGVRDPYIINKRDSNDNIIPGYYVVATDLTVIRGKTNNTYNNTKMLVWDVPNLADVSNVKPWVIETAGMFNDSKLKNSGDAIAWAPEVTWSYEKNMYVMFWSGPYCSTSNLQYAYTSDFQTFYNEAGTEITGSGSAIPDVLRAPQSGFKSIIDGTIVHTNNKYYLVFKTQYNSNGKETGTIFFTEGSTTIAGIKNAAIHQFEDSRYTGITGGNGQALEGPELFQRADGHWILLVDNYTVNPNFNYLMYDLGTNLDTAVAQSGDRSGQQVVDTNINTLMPRHGGMATISTTEMNALNAKYAGYTKTGELVAQYFTTSNVNEDATGHGYNLTSYNGLSTASIGGIDNAAYFSNGSGTASSSSCKYAQVSTAGMYNAYHFNAQEGVTIKWNAYDLGTTGTNSEYANVFNIRETQADPGTLAEASNNIRLAYVTGELCTGISNGSTIARTDGLTVVKNSWCAYKAVISLNGMQVYKNNQLQKSLVIHGVDDNWFQELFDGGMLTLGVSLFNNDRAFNGYISNLRIYNTANQENVARIDNPPVETTVATAVQDFENTMNSGKVYENMKPAYEAYVAYQKAYDAKVYGGVDSINLNYYAEKLAEKMTGDNGLIAFDYSEQSSWTAQKYKHETIKFTYPSFTGSNGDNTGDFLKINGVATTYENYYDNVLYGEARSGDSDQVTDSPSGKNTTFYLNYPEMTLLYDGTNTGLYTPVVASFKQTTKVNRWALSVVNNTANTQLVNSTDWYGTDQKENWVWLFTNSMSNDIGKIGTATGQNMKAQIAKSNGMSTWYKIKYSWANMFMWTGSFGTNEYIKEVTPSFTFYECGAKSKTNDPSMSYEDIVSTLTGTAKIRYINYKAVMDAEQTLKSTTLPDVRNYKQGGLSTYLQTVQTAIDSMKSLNINQYFADAASNKNQYTACANAIQTICDNVASIATASKTSDNDSYQALRDAIDLDMSGSTSNYELDSARTEGNNPNVKFTPESYADFNTKFTNAQQEFANLYNSQDNFNSYKATNVDNGLEKAYKSLMPKVDTVTLTNLVTTKQAACGSIYENGEQKYTLSSWQNLSENISTSREVIDDNTGEDKYERYTSSNKAVNGTTNFMAVTVAQNNVNAQTVTLDAVDLVECDTDDAYAVYEVAKNVVEASDKDKYSEEDLAELEALINQLETGAVRSEPSAYVVVNSTDIQAYNNAIDANKFTSKKITANDKLRSAEINTLDTTCTTPLLTKLNDMSINTFDAYLTVKSMGDNNIATVTSARHLVSTKAYGETFEFEVPAGENQAVTWEITATDKQGQTSTRIISDWEGNTLEKVADSDVEVVATISNKTVASKTAVYVLNAYGNVQEIKYVANAEGSGAEIASAIGVTAPVLQFYDFVEWGVNRSVDGVCYLIPIYEAIETVSIKTPDNTLGNAVKPLTYVTINSNATNFYAWAVDNGNSTYDIVSYNREYSFTALTSETYVPVIQDGDAYKINGVTLTASMVKDCVNTSGQTLSEDAFLKAKLDAQMPFTSIQMIEKLDNNGKTKVTVYCRATANSSVPAQAFGIYVKSGDAVKRFNIDGIAESGQYYASFTTTKNYDVASFVTYKFGYGSYDKISITNSSEYKSINL